MSLELRLRMMVMERLPQGSLMEVQLHKDRVTVMYLKKTDDLTAVLQKYQAHTIFWGVAPRSGPGGTLKDVLGINMLWTDLDRNTVSLSEIWPPTAIVNSGTRTNAHMYWFLDDIYEADDSMAAILYGIHLHLGADTTFDFTRRMRIPGSLNHKSKPPVLCSVREFHPERVFKAEQFLRWAKKRKGVTYQHSSLQLLQPVDIDALGLHPAIREMIEYGGQSSGAQRYLRADGSLDRSRMDMAIGRAVKEAGCSPEQVAWVLRTYECGGRCRAIRHGLRYLEYTVNRLFYD